MGYLVRQIDPTPNPNAMKFLLDRPVTDRPMSFFTAEAAAGHPLAAAIFAIDGVSNVLFLGDFITVSKRSEAKWPAVRRKTKAAIEKA